ncbi:hypothetical protein VTO73DRAFT_1 [Trametes versicolor]
MSLDAIDITGFVLTIITFLLGFGFYKRVIASRLPTARLVEIGDALAGAREHIRRLVLIGRITEERAALVRLEIDGLDKQYTDLWMEVDEWRNSMGWRRFVHPRTLRELLRSCSNLLKRVVEVRTQLRTRLAGTSIGAEPSNLPGIMHSPPTTRPQAGLSASSTHPMSSSTATFGLSQADSSGLCSPVPSNAPDALVPPIQENNYWVEGPLSQP